jgi:hypothetical protein
VRLGCETSMLGWARCGFHERHVVTRYAELVFLHPMGSVGHIVNSGAYGPQNIDALFVCSSGTGMDSTKCALGHITLNLCFCI